VRRPSSLFLSVLIALVLAGVSLASTRSGAPGPQTFVVGATEDQALWSNDGGGAVYDQMQLYGLDAVRMSVGYDPTQPTTIANEAALRRAIAPAVERGVRVLLSIAPDHSTDVTGVPNGVQKFAHFTALVAQAFPQVTELIVGNEPNLGRFWFPTFNSNGTIASGSTYEAALAASYDAIKAVNPSIDVIGLAVSPRGDDRPGSVRNTVSPVRFIGAVGAAYRRSGRTTPIMDNAALHPYPNRNDDPPDKGYPWPNAGVPSLDRVEQAFWDAFHGTGQPTFQEGGVRTMSSGGTYVRWILDEAGWQTKTQNLPGYDGSENVPTIDEATQARYHSAIVSRFACDPHVAALLFFHWVDETDRDRFQSGAIRADDTAKPVVDAVKQAIEEGCTGPQVVWRHSTSVDGAALDRTPARGFLFFVTANEDASFVATATPKPGVDARRATMVGAVKAYRKTGVEFPGINARSARNYSFTVRLSAAMNPARITTLRR
jgi:hypothetical protein